MTNAERSELERIMRDRFSAWSKTLFQRGACPILLIGITLDAHPVLCSSDINMQVDLQNTLKLLKRLVACIEENHVELHQVDMPAYPLPSWQTPPTAN